MILRRGKERLYQVAKVSRLYYVEGLSQRQIASRLNMSMAKISRLMSEARESGIVEIKINDPDERFRELEQVLEKELGLRECIIVPSRETKEATYQELSRPVGEFLSRFANKSIRLGVSWGETLKVVADNLDPGVSFSDPEVVPIIGGIGTIERGMYPNSVARMFANRIGGVSYLINAPAISTSKTVRNSLFADPRHETVFKLWGKMDIAISGVSALDPRDSISLQDGMYTEAELRELRALGAVSSMNSCFFDQTGCELETPFRDRILNVATEGLRNTAHVIIVAAAPHKVTAILSAAQTRLVHILITDFETAVLLVRALHQQNRPDHA
jgi:DNA-binding transcriptional regulator LsrR (DeoR family)